MGRCSSMACRASRAGASTCRAPITSSPIATSWPSATPSSAARAERLYPSGHNIYISALNFAGTADEVLALGRAGLIELCISRAILDETEGVLIRKFRWSTPRAREAMQAIRAFTVLVHRILECALAAGA